MKLSILEDIAAQRKHTMANRVLSPLVVAGFIRITKYADNGWQPKEVELTQAGWVKLKHFIIEDKELNE